MLGKLLNGAKTAVASIGKLATKGRFMKMTNFLGPTIQKNLFDMTKRMMTNAKTAKWWGRTARKVRLTGILATDPAGDELKAKKAIKWTDKGSKAFAFGGKSPKELEQEFKRKQTALTTLRLEAETQRKRAGGVQKELSIAPLSIDGIPEVGDKINALSGNIDKLRSDVGHINSMNNAQVGADKEARAEQSRANANIGEVVLQTSEGVTKVVLVGFEDIKNQNMGLHQETTGNIISTIGGKLDGIEEARKAEEEFKRKNDWKKKFLSNILLIMEWVLDFPGKIKMLIIKALVIAAMAITAVIAANAAKIKAFFSGDFMDQMSYLNDRLMQGNMLITKGLAYVVKGVGWLLNKLGLPGSQADKSGEWLMNLGDEMIQTTNEVSDMVGENADKTMKKMLNDYKLSEQNEQVKKNIEQSTETLSSEKPESFQPDPASISKVSTSEEVKDSKSKRFTNRATKGDPVSGSWKEEANKNVLFPGYTTAVTPQNAAFQKPYQEPTPPSMISKDGKSSIKPGTHDPTSKPLIPLAATRTFDYIKADVQSYVSAIPVPEISKYEPNSLDSNTDVKELKSAVLVMNENISSINTNIKTAANLTVDAVNAKVPEITKKVTKWKEVSNNNKSDIN